MRKTSWDSQQNDGITETKTKESHIISYNHLQEAARSVATGSVRLMAQWRRPQGSLMSKLGWSNNKRIISTLAKRAAVPMGQLSWTSRSSWFKMASTNWTLDWGSRTMRHKMLKPLVSLTFTSIFGWASRTLATSGLVVRQSGWLGFTMKWIWFGSAPWSNNDCTCCASLAWAAADIWSPSHTMGSLRAFSIPMARHRGPGPAQEMRSWTRSSSSPKRSMAAMGSRGWSDRVSPESCRDVMELAGKHGQGHKAKAGDGAQAKVTIVPSGVTNKQVNTHTHKKKTTAEAHHVRDPKSPWDASGRGSSWNLQEQHQTMTPHDFCSLRMFETVTCYNVAQCQIVPACTGYWIKVVLQTSHPQAACIWTQYCNSQTGNQQGWVIPLQYQHLSTMKYGQVIELWGINYYLPFALPFSNHQLFNLHQFAQFCATMTLPANHYLYFFITDITYIHSLMVFKVPLNHYNLYTIIIYNQLTAIHEGRHRYLWTPARATWSLWYDRRPLPWLWRKIGIQFLWVNPWEIWWKHGGL